MKLVDLVDLKKLYVEGRSEDGKYSIQGGADSLNIKDKVFEINAFNAFSGTEGVDLVVKIVMVQWVV